MQIGFCTGSGARDAYGVGYEIIPALAAMGYDYVELPLTQVAAMPEAVFEDQVLVAIEQAKIHCLALNNCFPGSMRLTGHEANHEQALTYAKEAFARAARLGAETIVFGSSGARSVPDGFPLPDAYAQLAALLRSLGDAAARHGLRIAIEPLNRMESNIVNTYESGLYLAALCAHPRVGVLADAYHMAINGEDYRTMTAQPPWHTHYARALGRRMPTAPDQPALFCAALLVSGYRGGLSVEARAEGDIEEGARQALVALREAGRCLA
ncbi:MAG: sugar phosphate isomerase/epimerase [Oscillospiraceae bacterium]|jgi:sugar phosphate isomerase/epimerase|nr:sugar phosphate isomerase/epimerase [Oscillospiraceae bacterium]